MSARVVELAGELRASLLALQEDGVDVLPRARPGALAPEPPGAPQTAARAVFPAAADKAAALAAVRAELGDCRRCQLCETRKTIVFVTHDISESVFLSQLILIVTQKPCTISSRIEVGVPYPRTYGDDLLFEMEKITLREFLKMDEDS